MSAEGQVHGKSEDGGALTLRVHDMTYTDNAGAFQVIVVQIPDSVIPEPVKVEAE